MKKTIAEQVAYVKATMEHLDKRINGSIDAIQQHIKEGYGWRRGILCLAVTIALQIIGFAYLYGKLTETVATNRQLIAALCEYLKQYTGKL